MTGGSNRPPAADGTQREDITDRKASKAASGIDRHRIGSAAVMAGVVLTAALILVAVLPGAAAASQGEVFDPDNNNTPDEETIWVLNGTDHTVQEVFNLTDDGSHLNVTQNGVDTQIDLNDQQNTSELLTWAAKLGSTGENDTLVVGPGTYNVSEAGNPAAPTADSDANVTHVFSAAGEPNPVFQAASGQPNGLLAIDNPSVNEITLENLTFEAENESDDGVGIWTTAEDAEVELSNVEINATNQSGLWVGAELDTLDLSETTIRNSDGTGFGVANTAANVSVSDSTFEDNDGQGIFFQNVNHSSISGSTIRNNNGTGISFQGVNESAVLDSTISGNDGMGIQLRNSHENELTGNTVTGNDGWNDEFEVRIDGDSADNAVENLNIGESTAADTTVSFEGRDVVLGAVSDAPDLSYALEDSLDSTDRYVDATVQPNGFLNVTIHTDTDSDDLAMWQNPYLDHWEKVFDATVDTDANAVTHNVTTGAGEWKSPTLGVFEDSTGTLTGSLEDGDGNAIDGEAFVHDRGHVYRQFDDDLPNGEFEFAVPEGTYSIFVDADGNTSEFREGIDVEAGETVIEDFELPPAVTIEGYVEGEGSGIDVFVNDGNQFYHNQTGADGKYTLEVPVGTHNVVGFDPSPGAERFGSNTSVTVEEGESKTDVNLTVKQATVSNENVSIVEGPGDASNIELETMLAPPTFLGIALNDTTNPAPPPNDLSGLGVDETTRFEIELTVEGIEPDSLLWGAKDVEWDMEDNDAGDGSNVTINASAVHLAGVEAGNISGTNEVAGPLPPDKDVSEIQWPTGQNDTAPAHLDWENTVFVMMLDTVIMPEEFQDDFEDVTINTNAQLFSTPEVKDGQLSVYVAGPGNRSDGSNHEGFYQAFLPDRLLDDWGVDDPEEGLNALVRGDPEDFTVEETDDGPRGTSGAWIELSDIHYSDGTIEIEAADDDGDGGTTTGGGSGTGASTETPDEGVAVPAEAVVAEEVQLAVDADPDREGTQIAFEATERTEELSFESEDISPTTSVEVSEADEPPEEVSPPSGEVRSVVQIDVPSTVENEPATIGFRLGADEVEDPDNVVMEHYDEEGDTWTGLETSVVETGEDVIRFEAETPGFSMFAVVEESAEPDSGADSGADSESGSDSEMDSEQDTGSDADSGSDADRDSDSDPDTEETPTADETEDTPGFGIVVAVIALLMSAVFAYRRE